MATSTPMQGRRQLIVRQVKEWGEILVGLETRNRYEILDEDNNLVGYAAEEGKGLGAMLLRNLLGRCRACTLHITDPQGEVIGVGNKPFRWFFHRMEASEGGRPVGAVQRKWSWFHRKFVIESPTGDEVLTIFSPLFRIWTFKLKFRDRDVGVIRKKWGGALRELFTDADTFGIEYDAGDQLGEMQTILLAATFLIDFTCFENNAGNRSFLSGD